MTSNRLNKRFWAMFEPTSTFNHFPPLFATFRHFPPLFPTFPHFPPLFPTFSPTFSHFSLFFPTFNYFSQFFASFSNFSPLLANFFSLVYTFLTFSHYSPLFPHFSPLFPLFQHFPIFHHFLAPPAERQRSFSNADSSVVRRPSVVNFSLFKNWISQKLPDNYFSIFWCIASLGRYPCTVKIWIWLNHPKGHFKRSERSNLAPW